MLRVFVLLGSVLLLIFIGFIPILFLFIKSFIADGRFSFQNYELLFDSKRTWILLLNSLSLSSATAFITLILGVPLGVLLTKTDLPLKRFFIILFIIPLIISPYILSMAWFYTLGRGGVVAGLLGEEIGAITSNFLFSFYGVLFVMVSVYLPVAIILTMTYLRTLNPALEEAARLSSKWFYILRDISLPLIKPGIMLSGLIVFVLTLGELGVPLFLRFDVFPAESFLQFSAFYNFNAAIAMAIPLGIITIIVLIIERRFLRKKVFQFGMTRMDYLIIPLKKTKPIFLIAVGLISSIIVILPLSVLIAKSIGGYPEAVKNSVDSIFRSLFYAGFGATLLVIIGFPMGYMLEHRAYRFYYTADSIAVFLFGLPGAVIGIGLIGMWNTPSTNFIYTSMLIILFGYIAQYTALSERITASALSQIPDSMEESAQLAGAGWLRRLFYIVIPLSKRGIISSWLVGFIFCLRDLGITMMVYPPQMDTLPVRIFTLMANSPEETIAALCVIMFAITLMPLGGLMVITRYMRW
ncbi:MAG: iron ABC transporter permease [Nitrospirae bacterium]|nr:iron ABC transporter permease [Nitrospirota bacterium]